MLRDSGSGKFTLTWILKMRMQFLMRAIALKKYLDPWSMQLADSVSLSLSPSLKRKEKRRLSLSVNFHFPQDPRQQ